MLGHLTPGTQVAGYEIERPLGRGGMGEVYLARRLGERRSVALKLLSSGLTADERFQERFERESHMATSLEHPHIVPVYAIGEIEGVKFIAMRYIDGPTLRDLVERESPLDVRRIASVLGQVATALDDAHEIGLVHRDIKPANILIARSGASEFREHAYLTDFGVSKYTGSDSGFTGTGQFVGTSLYGSPEQIRGEPIDGRADVYAFGCVLFECLIGRPPFERDNEAALLWAQMFEHVAAVSTLRSDLTPAFDEVVAKAMAKSRGDRYDKCGDVIVALREAILAAPGQVLAGRAAPVVAPPLEQEPPPASETVVKPTPLVEATQEESVPQPTEPEEPVQHEAPGQVLAGAAAPLVAPPLEQEPPPASETVVKPAPPVETTQEGSVPKPVEPEEPVQDEAPGQLTAVRPEPEPVESAALLTAAIEEPDPERHEESGERAAAVGEDTPAPSVAPAKETANAPETTVRPSAGAMAASAASAASAAATPPLQAAENIVVRSTADTEIRPAPVFEAVPSEAGTSRGELTVAEDRVLTSPRAEPRRRMPALLLVGVILAIAALGGGLYLLFGGGTSDPPARPSNTALPTITGLPRTGETLRAALGTWDGEPTSYRYAWQRCKSNGGKCTAIAGANARTLTLTERDVDMRLRVAVTASNDAGARTTLSRPTHGVLATTVRPSNIALPTVSGFADEGSTLRVGPGTWKGTKPLDRSYLWLRCDPSGSKCVAIRGGRAVEYELTAQDVGHRIRVEERVRNAAGAASARSSATTSVEAKQVTQTTPTETTPTTTTEPEPTICPPVCPNG